MQKLLIRTALICVLLSVTLYVLASRWIGVVFDCGMPVKWLYVAAHLLAGYGMAVLLWPAAASRGLAAAHHLRGGLPLPVAGQLGLRPVVHGEGRHSRLGRSAVSRGYGTKY